MSKTWMKMRRSLILLTMGGATLGIFAFGDGGGCYALFGDYQTLFQSAGDAAIATTSDNVFGNVGTDFDAVVRDPATAFVQAVWENWVDAQIPDDLPNNPIVRR